MGGKAKQSQLASCSSIQPVADGFQPPFVGLIHPIGHGKLILANSLEPILSKASRNFPSFSLIHLIYSFGHFSIPNS
jgi:hypothetical protein